MWVASARRRRRFALYLGLAAVMAWSCSNGAFTLNRSGSESAAPGTNFPPGFAAAGALTSGTPGVGNPGSDVPSLPPEIEQDPGFRLPVLSGRFVWAANPESGRVSAIDTRSLEVQVAQAGFAPTYLASLPTSESVLSRAIVLNARSHDASVLTLTDKGITTAKVPTHVGANAWTVSPSGRFAIAWTNSASIDNPDVLESFQDLTVIDTERASATRLSVGYRPSRIFVQEDEQRAFVVSEPGLSVIELTDEPFIGRDLALSDSSGRDALDVAVVPSGTHAILRFEGSPHVILVEIESGTESRVTLSGPVTDLDLVADGSAAIAVVRGQPVVPPSAATGASGAGGEGGESGESGAGGAAGAAAENGGEGGATGGSGGTPPPTSPGYGPSEIAVLPIPGVLNDPALRESVQTDELVGSVSVSERGDRALLYTTATESARVVTLATAPDAADYLAPRTIALRAPVEAVFIAPDAEHAVVSLKRGSSAGGAFGVVPLHAALPVKTHVTDAPVTGVAFAPAPTRHAVVIAKTGLTAYVVKMPSFLVTPVELPSLPLAAGIIAEENAAFIVEEHPEGRLSLIDLESAEQRTLTGFELSAGVRP